MKYFSLWRQDTNTEHTPRGADAAHTRPFSTFSPINSPAGHPPSTWSYWAVTRPFQRSWYQPSAPLFYLTRTTITSHASMSSTQTKTPMEASAARALATATTEELSTVKGGEPMPNSSSAPAATVSANKRGKVKITLFPDSSQESAGTETHVTDESQNASQEEFVECTPVVDMTELASSTDVASRRRPSGAASADIPRLRQLKSAVLPSPRAGESSSSQAKEVGAVDPDIVEHTEYTQMAIQDARYHRAIRRSHPRLWLHSRRCLKSVCLFEGIDDGSNIVKTGVVWR